MSDPLDPLQWEKQPTFFERCWMGELLDLLDQKAWEALEDPLWPKKRVFAVRLRKGQQVAATEEAMR